jgi:hypothetical protein
LALAFTIQTGTINLKNSKTLETAHPLKMKQGINFTNKLRAAFAPIFLRQKSTNPKSKYKKAPHKTFVRKSCA